MSLTFGQETHVVGLTDVFEIKPNMPGSNHEPGAVVIFDGRQCSFEIPAIGQSINLLRPDGQVRRARVGEIKEHGDGRSFFFAGLNRSDIPTGTVLTWQTTEAKAGMAVDSHRA